MFWWLAQNTLLAAALAGVVALLCRGGRFRPAVRHALWLVVLVKLVTPPGVHWPWALPEWEPLPCSATVAPTEPPASAESLFVPGELQELLLAEEVVPAAALDLPLLTEQDSPPPGASDQPAETALPSWPATLASLGLYLWLAGAAAMGVVHTIRIVRFRRLLARARPAPLALARLLQEQAAKLHVPPPALLVVPDLGSPLLWCLCRPKLLWPAALLNGLPEPCRRSVLTHELAHLRRRDHWVGWLLLLAGCLWWWNPVFWYVRRQVRHTAELACDAWVVAVLPRDRRAYAEALIEVSQLVAGVAAPVPALGMSRGPRQSFERRLTMIMRERVPCRIPAGGCLAIGLLTLIALPGWSLGQKTDDPPKPQEGVYYYVPVQEPVNVTDVFVQAVPPPAPPAQPGGLNEQKLQELEHKLDALLKEVKALRGGSTAAPLPSVRTRYELVQPSAGARFHVQPTLAVPAVSAVPTMQLTRPDVTVRHWAPSAATVMLTRTTYKLPRGKAEALATFLREHVKASVMEAKVEGETLIITTTPEAQKAIGQLISLIQGGSAEKPAATKAYPATAVPVADHLRYFFGVQEAGTPVQVLTTPPAATDEILERKGYKAPSPPAEKPETKVFNFKFPDNPQEKSAQPRP